MEEMVPYGSHDKPSYKLMKLFTVDGDYGRKKEENNLYLKKNLDIFWLNIKHIARFVYVKCAAVKSLSPVHLNFNCKSIWKHKLES